MEWLDVLSLFWYATGIVLIGTLFVDNMECFDVLSLFWYATGMVFTIGTLFIATAVWLFFEFYRASVGDEDDPKRHSHKSK